MKLLVTGLTGKLGTHFLPAFRADPRFAGATIRAICNNRVVDDASVEIVRGSLSDVAAVARAMAGVTHVLHMAAVKESPILAMDVGVKGLFNLLEAFRASPAARQFILIGGDCSVGHIFHAYPTPITETSPRRAYPGCYALTKVIEEAMLEQYRIQYGLDTCCLRAPWIMEKDDFRYALSFREQFGGPAWSDLIDAAALAAYVEADAVPMLGDATGRPLKRGFIHVSDVVSAILAALDNPTTFGETFNIAMDAPVDYCLVANHLRRTRGRPIAEIRTPYHSNWLDNAKARHLLGWQPLVGWHRLVEMAWDYVRGPGEPRFVAYPG